MTNEELERAVDTARNIEGFTTRVELLVLARLASQVPSEGLIIEVGPLRGRSTAAMALCTRALIISVDSFADGHAAVMPEFLQNVQRFSNVALWRADSREAVKHWWFPVNLLFVDGGHSYEEARSDLFGFGPFVSGAIVVHDWGTPGVKKAAQEWMETYRWQVCEKAGDLVVLRRPDNGMARAVPLEVAAMAANGA